MKKRILILCVAVCIMLLAFGVINVSAASSGTCGDKLTWILDDAGTLTISGRGNMKNWSYYSNTPWYSEGENITKVVIKDGVTSIGDYAFRDCSSLASVTIGDGVTSIGNSAFSSCSSLASITIGDSVTSIGDCAFSGCSSLASITIPDSVTSIGGSAFSYCDSLASITIGDSVTSIGNSAFRDCDSLASITIPDSVTSIGDYAFSNCSSLASITIPDSVTSIGNYAFDYCRSLKKVNITNMEAWYNIDFSGYTSNPLHKGGELYLNGNLVTNITIPDSVTSIGDYAFYGCDSLASITIPDSVTSIGERAFSYCDSLASITNGDSVISIGEYAFYYCSSLASITIPDSVTSIGNSAFSNCSRLASITIGDGVTSIGNYAFYYCSSLASITIGDSVTSIGEYAFYYCNSLKKVNITNMEAWCNIEFGSSTSSPMCYGGELYLNGNLVTNITIPDSVTSIGEYAFSGCASLASITIPDSVTSIGDYVFSDCSSLASITIPDSVTGIGNYAFSNCSSLASITIPDSVTSIGYYAFSNCSSLASITIPDSVTSIGNSAFRDCDSLASITIPDGVETIPINAFYSCDNLEYVCLPQGIKYIRNDAFNNCSNIKTVFYAGSEEEWNEILFYNRNENLTNAKIVCNATKKTYKFETNCDAKLDDVTDYAIFIMPTVQNEGERFSGWYDNEALSGEPVSFPYYGDAKTLYASWTDRTGKNFDDAFVAKPNQEYTVTTTESGQLVYFEFVPNLSKNYKFYTTGSKDTYGYLYNSNKSQIASNDDAGEGNNFYISYNLTAGQKYYIAAKVYSGTGTFTFVIEEPVDYRINEIAIKDMSGNSLGEIPKGTFLATVSFANVSSSADTVIVLAQYTSKGAFKGLMFVQTEDVPTGSTIKLSIPVDNSEGDVAKLKAMCWESFGSQTPMGNSATFPAE